MNFLALINIAFVLSAVVLAITGLGAEMIFHEVRGYMLMLHLGASGLFTLCLPIVAYMLISQLTPNCSKLFAVVTWILLAACGVNLGTAVVCMMPWLDTPGLEATFGAHEFSGKVIVISGVMYLFILRKQPQPAAAAQ